MQERRAVNIANILVSINQENAEDMRHRADGFAIGAEVPDDGLIVVVEYRCKMRFRRGRQEAPIDIVPLKSPAVVGHDFRRIVDRIEAHADQANIVGQAFM